jgi:DNA-binding MltR family transcriptional regulator
MNWVLLLRIKKVNKDTVFFKIVFTDITLSSPFKKIEEVLNISSNNKSEIENKITSMLNHKVALKEHIYIVYDDEEEYDFIKQHMPSISNRMSDEINLKSFFIITSHIITDGLKNLLKHW